MSEICAYHESGHATMAFQLGATVRSISIDPEWDDDYLRHDGEIEVHMPSAQLSSKQLSQIGCMVALAGPAAEMVYTGDPFHPATVREWSKDWSQAWELAGELHGEELVRLRFLEMMTRELYQTFSRDHVWQAVASLADELLAHEHLESEQIHDVLSCWLSR